MTAQREPDRPLLVGCCHRAIGYFRPIVFGQACEVTCPEAVGQLSPVAIYAHDSCGPRDRQSCSMEAIVRADAPASQP